MSTRLLNGADALLLCRGEWPRGGFAVLAVLTGALVEYGGSPLPLAGVAPERALDVLRLRTALSHIWATIGGGRPEPRPAPGDELDALVDQVVGRAADFGRTPRQARALLADRLIGDRAQGLLPGLRPEPAWVVAATDGPPQLSLTDAVTRRFRLHDATGVYQAPEGRPADIPSVDGARVLTVHPAQVNKQWNVGRIYEHMRPSLALDHVMPADEAGAWLARVQPAREPDMFHV